MCSFGCLKVGDLIPGGACGYLKQNSGKFGTGADPS